MATPAVRTAQSDLPEVMDMLADIPVVHVLDFCHESRGKRCQIGNGEILFCL
jgi:hypothetical protein